MKECTDARYLGFRSAMLYGHSSHENDNAFLKKDEKPSYDEYRKGAKDAEFVLRMAKKYNFDIDKSELN